MTQYSEVTPYNAIIHNLGVADKGEYSREVQEATAGMYLGDDDPIIVSDKNFRGYDRHSVILRGAVVATFIAGDNPKTLALEYAETLKKERPYLYVCDQWAVYIHAQGFRVARWKNPSEPVVIRQALPRGPVANPANNAIAYADSQAYNDMGYAAWSRDPGYAGMCPEYPIYFLYHSGGRVYLINSDTSKVEVEGVSGPDFDNAYDYFIRELKERGRKIAVQREEEDAAQFNEIKPGPFTPGLIKRALKVVNHRDKLNGSASDREKLQRKIERLYDFLDFHGVLDDGE